MSITIPTDAYCDLTDVKGRLPHITISSGTNPTETEAEELIKDIANEMNGLIGKNGYTVPIDDSTGIKVLKSINILGATVAVLDAITSHDPDAAPVSGPLREEYQGWLEMLRQNQVYLGAEEAAEGVHTPKGEFNLDSTGSERDPVFTRDMDF